MALAQLFVAKTHFLSKGTASPVPAAATDAKTPLKIVCSALRDMSEQDPSASEVVFLISSSMPYRRGASLVDLAVQPALPSPTAPHAQTKTSNLEEEFALTAPTPVLLAMGLALAHPV